MNLNELKDKAGKVSDDMFGKERGPIGPVKKLKDEVDELLECFEMGEDPGEEFADCLLILIDAYRKHYGDDVDMQKLIDDSSNKLDVVTNRTYKETDIPGVFQHVKEDDGDPFDMSVHSAGSDHYLPDFVPHHQKRTWDGLDMDLISKAHSEVFDHVAFDTITPEIREKIRTFLWIKLPGYDIKCDEENNDINVVESGHVIATISDEKTKAYVDVIF